MLEAGLRLSFWEVGWGGVIHLLAPTQLAKGLNWSGFQTTGWGDTPPPRQMDGGRTMLSRRASRVCLCRVAAHLRSLGPETPDSRPGMSVEGSVVWR